MTEVKQTKTKPAESFMLWIMSIGTLFYTAFLGKIVWGWFLAEKLFTVGYWELFLGIIAVRFIFGINKGSDADLRMNEKFGVDNIEKRLGRGFGYLLGYTTVFGILFIVKLIISYYS